MRACVLVLVLVCCSSLGLAYRPQLHINDTEQACPGRPAFSKVVLCYYEGRAAVSEVDPCLCSHLVFTNAARFPEVTSSRVPLAPVTLDSSLTLAVQSLRKRNPELRLLGRVSGGARAALISSRGAEVAASLARMTRQVGLDGLEIALDWEGARVGGGAQGKQRLIALVKGIRSALLVASNRGGRVKRSYSVREEIVDDIPRPTWISGLYIRPNGSVGVLSTTTSTTQSPEMISNKPVGQVEKEPLLLLQVSAKPGVLGKRFDLKPLSKYVDFFTVPTHNMTDESEVGVTYHPSRLMGLSDILNTDSVLDLLTGLGAPASRIIVTLPASAQRFQLVDSSVNKPRSPAIAPPTVISHQQVCSLLSQGGWMVERDEDLTAPYAFRNESWIAFDDELSVEIKGKYALLRGLAGVGVWSIDDDDLANVCGRGRSGLTRALASTFVTLARRTRSAVLQSLVEPLAAANSPLLVPVSSAGPVTLSPYRIVRVVDRTGAVQVVRRDAQNEYECSRQGYYRHPLGCDRFYRCVKFDQRADDFSVFEYDCPPGLAFDERWEVCVWPGQARAPCDGTSEIRPVPRSKFTCSAPGYYADPENCRWFFACMDHRRDGFNLTPYEFRCPYGLGFDEQNLMCNWPWMVPNCGGAGVSGQISGSGVVDVTRGSVAKQNFDTIPVINTVNPSVYQSRLPVAISQNIAPAPLVNTYTSNAAPVAVQPAVIASSGQTFSNIPPQITPLTKVTPDFVNEEFQVIKNKGAEYPVHVLSDNERYGNTAPSGTGSGISGFTQPIIVPSGPESSFNQPQFVNSVSASGPSGIGGILTKVEPIPQLVYNTQESQGNRIVEPISQLVYNTQDSQVNGNVQPVLLNIRPQFIDNVAVNDQGQFDRTLSQIQINGVRNQPAVPIVAHTNTRVASNILTQTVRPSYGLPQNRSPPKYGAPPPQYGAPPPAYGSPTASKFGLDISTITEQSVFDSEKLDFGLKRPVTVAPYSNYGPPGIKNVGISSIPVTQSPNYLPQQENRNAQRPNVISSQFFNADSNQNTDSQLNNFKYPTPGPTFIPPTQNTRVINDDGPTGILPTVTERPIFGARIPQGQTLNSLSASRVRNQQNSVTILSPDSPTSDLGQLDVPEDNFVNSISTTPVSGFSLRPTVPGRPSISNIVLTASPVNDEEDDESTTNTPSSTFTPPTSQAPDETTFGTRNNGFRNSVNDDTIQSLLDTYSGRFGGLFNNGNNNEQFIQDVISNRNRGNNNGARTQRPNSQNFESLRDTPSTTPNLLNRAQVSTQAKFIPPQSNNPSDFVFPSTTAKPISSFRNANEGERDEINIEFVNNGQFFAQNNRPSTTTSSSFESTSNNIDTDDFEATTPQFNDFDGTRTRQGTRPGNTAAELNNFNNRFIGDESSTPQSDGGSSEITRPRLGKRPGETAAELNNFNNRFIGDDFGAPEVATRPRQGTRQGNTAAELNNFNNRFVDDDETSTRQNIDDLRAGARGSGNRPGNTAAELNNFNNRFIDGDGNSDITQRPNNDFGASTRGRQGTRQGNSAAELNNFNNRFIDGDGNSDITQRPSNEFGASTRGRQGTRQGSTAAELNNFNNRFINDESDSQQSTVNDNLRSRGQGTRQGNNAAEFNNFNNGFIDDQTADNAQISSNSRQRQGSRQGNSAAVLNNFNSRRINDQAFESATEQNVRASQSTVRNQEVYGNRRGSIKFSSNAEPDTSSTIQETQVSSRRNSVTVISKPTAVNTIPLVEKLEGTTGEGLGRRFDRYGPGGWRSANETLGPDACQREGLFRHPNDCNKFYECFYDSWKERYTIHIFNCPIRLAYDPTISACNWPIDGPGCSGNRLLLHVN